MTAAARVPDEVRRERARAARLIGVRRPVEYGVTDIPTSIEAGYDALYVALRGRLPAGGRAIFYVPTGARTADMIVGYTGGAIRSLPANVVGTVLPSGPVVTAHHVGSLRRLWRTHDRIHRWMAERGYPRVGPHWELYDEIAPGVDGPVTTVRYSLLPWER